MKKKLSKIMVWLLALTMMFSLVACTTDDEADPVGSNDGDHIQENRGIVTNLQASASTSDPFAHANVNDREWLLNCYEPLFCYNGLTGEHEPRVGKSFEISDDGLTYTIEIFDNIYFQNGKHCTAEDIKSSYEYGQASAYNTKFNPSIIKNALKPIVPSNIISVNLPVI